MGRGSDGYNGQSLLSRASRDSGWDYRKVSFWDFIEGRQLL
jgi:hypothetical protein